MDISIAPDGAGITTLEAARDAAREHHVTHPDQMVHLHLADGTHRVTETLVLTHEDAHTTWCAADGAQPIITGAVPITGWRKLGPQDEPGYLACEASGKVWVAELPDTLGVVRTVLRDGRKLPRARGEGFVRTKVAAEGDAQFTTFGYPPGALDDWPDRNGVELVIMPKYPWTMNVLPLGRVDTAAGIAHTDKPCTYPIHTTRQRANMWVENSLAALRQPGMWVYHHPTHRLYHWPEGDGEPVGVAAASLTELIRVEGTIDTAAAHDQPVLDIHFKGLTFTGGSIYPWHGRSGLGLQHDWDMHDAASAILRFRGADDCSVERCTFRDAGSGGLRLDLHAQHNRIEGNLFARLGGTGITLAGYGLGTKDANRHNTIRNNHIHDIGQVYWHSPGIFVWQSGSNDVSHNHVHHVGYTGIVASGRTAFGGGPTGECVGMIRTEEIRSVYATDASQNQWHHPDLWRDDWLKREPFMHSRLNRIESNDIHDVMQILGDGNGIYISGAGRGNVVRGNFIHDCASEHMNEGIRCDDDQHDTLIEANVIVRIGGMATGICSKGVNDIINNIVAIPAAEATARGMISLEVGPMTGATISHNIIVADNADQQFYYQQRISVHGTGPDPLLRDAATAHNLYWCTGRREHAESHLSAEQARGTEQHSIVADPRFVNPANDDWRLADDSPAHDLGTRSIDVRQAGPTAALPLPPEDHPV